MPAKRLIDVVIFCSLLAEDVLAFLYDLFSHNLSAINVGEQAGSRAV
jgi:hypothetical protein